MKLSIQRILFPTDFSNASQNARDHACAIAGLLGSELHVLHVIQYPYDPPGALGSWCMPETNRIPESVPEVEQQLTSQMENSLVRDSLIVKAIRLGEPCQEILKYAADNDIQLIVLGTHGRTGMSRLLIGSVAELVIQRSICPVLSVHSESHQMLTAKHEAAPALART